MKPEFILAIERSVLKENNGFLYEIGHNAHLDAMVATVFVDGISNSKAWVEEVLDKHAIIARRDYLETNETFLQVLPYNVFLSFKGENIKVFVYKRTKIVGETRLAGKASFGIGGHIDIQENDIKSSIVDIIKRSIAREFKEEIEIRKENIAISLNFDEIVNTEFRTHLFDLFLLDNSNEVGRVHLGLIKFINIDPFLEKHGLDLEHVFMKEKELETVGFVSIDDLGDYDLENWSLILKDNLKALQNTVKGAIGTQAEVETLKALMKEIQGQPDLQG